HAIDAVLRPSDEEAIAIAQRLSTASAMTVAFTTRGQVPPLSVPSKAWGFARLQYDASSRQLAIVGFFGELSSAPRAIGLSALNVFRAPLGEAGPISRPLDLELSEDDTSGTFETQLTLTPLEAAQFQRGELYLTLHTIANPAGELRGQLRPPSDREFVEDGAIEFGPR
ncbi:MAG: CHRD domain-containing protein, partial [Cyanobacteria bacterium J06648_11]